MSEEREGSTAVKNEQDEIETLQPSEVAPDELIPKDEVKDEIVEQHAAISPSLEVGEKVEERDVFMDEIAEAEKQEEPDEQPPPGEMKEEEFPDIKNEDAGSNFSDDDEVIVSKRRPKTKVLNEEEAWREMLLDYNAEDEVIKSISKINTSSAITEARPATKEQLDSITLSRSRHLAVHCQYHFFEQLVTGAFVRAVVRNTTPVKYSLFEVIGCEATGVNPVNGAALKYNVDGVETDWLLICKTGTHKRKIRLSNVSNNKATDKEFVEYVKRMNKHQLPIIQQKRAIEVRNKIWETYTAFYNEPRTEHDVEQIVNTRARLRGNASVNLIKNKVIVQNQLEQLAVKRMDAEEKGESIREGEFEQRCLEAELEETENKLQSILYGQNSSFGTLAALTLRNAEANKGRQEAEDLADAVVFGRKQGRSGKSYWSVGQDGFKDKKQEIDMFWKKRKQEEQSTKDKAETLRKIERQRGTCPIKDLDGLYADVCASTQGSNSEDPETLLSQQSVGGASSQPSPRRAVKYSQTGASQQSTTTPTKAKRRLGLSDIRKKLRPGN